MPTDKRDNPQHSQSNATKQKRQYPIQENTQKKAIDLTTLSPQERTRLDTAVIMLVDYILSANKEKVV
jgi:hypothetical protein